MQATAQGQQLVDATSRTHLLLAHLGLIEDLDEAESWLNSRQIHLMVGVEASRDSFAQAAAATVVTLAQRASFSVSIEVGDLDAMISSGIGSGQRLPQFLISLGAKIADRPASAAGVAIGNVQAPASNRSPQIQITWDGWVAGVRPIGQRLGERPGCVLASIAAAALGVSELFLHHIGHVDASWRDVTLSLWDPLSPDPASATGTLLTRLPDRLMLVGLGHLGQAFAWCIAHLPYKQDDGEVWLIDDDCVSAANISTGVLTGLIDYSREGVQKTRLVGAILEQVGLKTRLLECRLPLSYRWEPGHPDVALIGIDNLGLRRRLSGIEWPLCVDAGLGSTASSFAALSIHSFPGCQSSTEIESWKESNPPIAADSLAPAFLSLTKSTTDQCGMVMLANQAVAAAFVGMVAACLAVSEPLRRLHGGAGIDVVSLSLGLPNPRGLACSSAQVASFGSVPVRSAV
jgi:hypothetical protein